jgi:hypothetical protein
MNTYDIDPEFPVENYFETETMNDMLKLELLAEASKRMSLQELELRLGTKHDIAMGKVKPLN